MSCVISDEKVCSATGNSRYKTFGGKRFKLTGKCEYVLAKDSNEKFVILQDKELCGKRRGKATCTNAVTVKIQGMTIYLKRGENVQVNGTEIILPYVNQGMENNTVALSQFLSGILMINYDF